MTENFNPNSFGSADSNIYGLPYSVEDAKIVIVPVPWDVTVSYSDGTSRGPEAIFNASFQVDLFDPFVKDAWKIGLAMEDINPAILNKNDKLRVIAKEYIDFLISGGDFDQNPEMQENLNKINLECTKLHKSLKDHAKKYLDKGKIVGFLGGEHSIPLGLIDALTEKHGEIGVLHIDAHADLRDAYEGFEFSHASIMFNVLKNPKITKLVQIGIRDYCEDEYDLITNSKGRIETYFDRDLRQRQFEGDSYRKIVDELISKLPRKIYISFDIDGLDSKYCPNTGTPVPGGLEFEQTMFLFEKIAESGIEIVGFDVNEVGPAKCEDGEIDLENPVNEWDANVGARVLYRLANITAKTNDLNNLNK